jgi:hypothetical protein
MAGRQFLTDEQWAVLSPLIHRRSNALMAGDDQSNTMIAR